MKLSKAERDLLYNALSEYGANKRNEAYKETQRAHDFNAEWAVKMRDVSNAAFLLRDKIMKPE